MKPNMMPKLKWSGKKGSRLWFASDGDIELHVHQLDRKWESYANRYGPCELVAHQLSGPPHATRVGAMVDAERQARRLRAWFEGRRVR